MKISLTINNTHVENSYLITKTIDREVYWIIERRKANRLPITRTTKSYIREWKAHNRLYKLGLFRSHTKDVDLEENIPLWKEIIWIILGI